MGLIWGSRIWLKGTQNHMATFKKCAQVRSAVGGLRVWGPVAISPNVRKGASLLKGPPSKPGQMSGHWSGSESPMPVPTSPRSEKKVRHKHRKSNNL